MSLAELLQYDVANLNTKLHKIIKFNHIGSTQQAFSLCCEASVDQVIISPQIWEIKEKMLPKRVVSKSPTRSRSPSPNLHK